MIDPQIDYQGPAQPGTPLEPDELEPSPPEFQKATQSGREEPEAPKAHPTSALSTQKRGRSPGPVSKGSHPTNELNLRRR
jgi:hypothetical protein